MSIFIGSFAISAWNSGEVTGGNSDRQPHDKPAKQARTIQRGTIRNTSELQGSNWEWTGKIKNRPAATKLGLYQA